jgi:hypothetical protein
MVPTRGSMLAGLVFVAVAGPVTAYAVSGDDPEPAPPVTTHGPSHPAPKTPRPEHTTGTEHAAEASAPGRDHADAMKAWARCVAEAASGPKAEDAPIPPKEACDDKPVSPGRAKHAPAPPPESPGMSGDHRSGHGRGLGHGHQG